jgi:translocation and assembly module TamB
MDITGQVFIPKVSMKSFTPPASVTISNDVVFVDVTPEERERRRSTRWQIYSHVKLIFGDDVTFDGYGLRGKVAGDLIVTDEPGKGTVGQGALHINEGKFRAFGVGLNIDIGRIIFAGGPVNDPGLSVRASRRYDDITVGVNVQGRLRSPEISTFSIPYMPESEAMSYLLFGRARTNYNFALGDSSANGDNGTGVDLGNLLSPGYYVDYLVGAFNPTSVMRIRFDLTDHIEIRAESAPTYQAGDIIYKFER